MQGSREKADPSPLAGLQMGDGEPGSFSIIHADRIDTLEGDLTVDEHDRPVPAQVWEQLLIGNSRAAEDNAIDAVRFEHRECGHFAFGLFVGVAEKDGIAVFEGNLFSTAHNIGKEGIGDVRHDQTEGKGAVSGQAAGNMIGTIAQLLDGLLDALACGKAGLTGLIEDA